jgi:hypothetical protein
MGGFMSSSKDPSDSMDILAAVFFVVAGIWLALAMSYSFMIVLFLRMRARGELDAIYDEEFGRIYLPGSSNHTYRLYLPTGCIFRRYMHHLQQEQRRQPSSSSSSSSRAEAAAAADAAARYMTTEERRRAMEVLLWEQRDTQKTVHSRAAPVAAAAAAPTPVTVTVPAPASESSEPTSIDTCTDTDTGTADQADSDIEEGPMCIICLDEFTQADDTNNCVLHSPKCSHLFHKDCIMDWLQRHGTRECPCCRVPMITEDEVWDAVQRLRKERRMQVRRETVWCYMFRREGELEERNNGISSTEASENTDDDDVLMVSPTLSSETASSEEGETESPADANV